VYPAILTTHIRLLEQRSQTVTSAECSFSLYISDVYHSAVALVESAASCPEWEFAHALCVTPLVEALLRGDHGKLEGGMCEAGTEETEYDLFAEGEEDNGACFALAGHFL